MFLVNAIKLLDRALLSEELLGNDASVADTLPLAGVFISAMLDFLRGMFARAILTMPSQLLMISRAPFIRVIETLLL